MAETKELPSGWEFRRLWTNGRFVYELEGMPGNTHLSHDDILAMHAFATGEREKPARRSSRKVVQVSTHNFPLTRGDDESRPITGDVLVAVCDDGTMWWCVQLEGRWQAWEQLEGPPAP